MDKHKMDTHAHHQMHMDESHEMSHMMHMGNLKKKFWLSFILAIPILLLSPVMGVRLPFQLAFPGSDWVVLILASILFIYGGQPFLTGAKQELRQKSPAMMTLIAMGISVAYVYSVYSFVADKFLHKHVMDFFWELATLIVIMLLGHWIEMRTISNAGSALQQLAELLPDEVRKINQGKEEMIPLKEVQVGDFLLVRAGDKIPADGVIEKGATFVDESMITGESKSVPKKVSEAVIGGSVNGSGTITLRVTATGSASYLSQIMTLVENAQKDKSKLETLSDKVSKWLFYAAFLVGIGTFIGWLIVTKDINKALAQMVTVFVIACPHALGLAIPLVVARAIAIAAKHGLLIKNRAALEQATTIEEVMLDKTGTLTQGKFSVTGIVVVAEKMTEAEALAYIGALEKETNHPLAVGVMKALQERKITPLTATAVQTQSGVGVSGIVNGEKVALVNEKEMTRLHIAYPEQVKQKFEAQSNTVSYLLIDHALIAVLALGDQIKPEAASFIQQLKQENLEPVLLTGDNQAAAQAVANTLGISIVHASLLPEDKEKIIQTDMARGKKVMMVGDGINDAPSLTRATIGIAIGAGTDIAIDSADVVLINSNPKDILRFLDLSRQTRRKMIQNLWWGAGYNILALPLAAGILAPWGIVLSPAVGAIFMSLSTVIVAINAMTLRVSGFTS